MQETVRDEIPMTDMTSDYRRCAVAIGKNIGSTAKTIREKVTELESDPRAFMEFEVKGAIRQHPGASLLIAAGAGLLVGRALRH